MSLNAAISSGEMAFGSMFANLKPMYVDYTVVDVKISTSSLVFKSFVKAFTDGVKDKLEVGGGALPVTMEELSAYLAYAVYARVAQVDTSGKKPPCIWRRHDAYFVPSFLAVFIAQIGNVEKAEIGIKLRPTWEGEVPVVDSSLLSRVSNLLHVLENHGFEMMRGMPRGNEGSWAMMSMEMVEGHVRNTTPEHHPSFAVMAAFFNVTGLQEVLGAQVFRVKYVSVEQASEFAWEVTHGAKARA